MISAIIPVLNEANTVASIIDLLRSSPRVSEILVIDDGSIDGTPEIAQAVGAKVMTSTLLGKGASMEDGLRAAKNDILLFLDGDLTGFSPNLVEVMTAPLLDGSADFVKGKFSRRAGRVTVLAAQPLLYTFYPELASIAQPLGGIIASTKQTLQKLHFESDYGVDVGLLIEAFERGARIIEADIGSLEHRSQPLEVLGDMAKQVARVILKRAGRSGRLDPQVISEIEEVERHARAEVGTLLKPIPSAERLALIDMDGTLVQGRFVEQLALRTGQSDALSQYLDNTAMKSSERTEAISAIFRGVSRRIFEEVAKEIPLMDGAVDLIVGLRKLGFRVGIVSDSFHTATEIVRRRVFAEFSIAHIMRFRSGVATGQVTVSPAMAHPSGCEKHPLCKRNVLLHLSRHFDISPHLIVAIGDHEGDICMFESAAMAIAVEPKTAAVRQAAGHVVGPDLREILPIVEASMSLA